MLRLAIVLLVISSACAQGQNGELGYTDTPILPGQPFHVHDPARPHPRVVTPAAQVGGAPSDAVVLFDGKDLSHWRSAKLDPVNPQLKTDVARWKVQDGYFEVAPQSGDIGTVEKFGDIQLH